MKILLDLQDSMRAVTLNSEFSLCGLMVKHVHVVLMLFQWHIGTECIVMGSCCTYMYTSLNNFIRVMEINYLPSRNLPFCGY